MARRPLRDLNHAVALAALLVTATTAAGCSSGAAGPAGPGRTAAAGSEPTGPTGQTGRTGQTGHDPAGPTDDPGPGRARPSPGTSPAPLVGVTTAAPGTPDAAALAVARAWFSWDTGLDGRPNDTVRRLALPLLAPALRDQVRAFTADAAPGDSWARWSARHARATVESALGGDDRPDDEPGTAWRQVLVRVVLRGDGGWEETVARTVFVRLDRVDGAWLAADVQSATSG